MENLSLIINKKKEKERNQQNRKRLIKKTNFAFIVAYFSIHIVCFIE